MKKGNILITTYHEAFLTPGGGEIELIELSRRLKLAGFHVDIYGSTCRHISAYDFILHFSVHGGGLALLNQVKKYGKKIILWPNLWWVTPPDDHTIQTVRDFFSLADLILFKSSSEYENVSEYTNGFTAKTVTIPWLIDEKYFNFSKNTIFKKIYNLERYVLWTGVFEPCKNQLSAIRALRDLATPIVFIGAPKDLEYFNQCRSEAPSHFLFIPQMSPASDILCSAIQNCSTFLELSFDPPGASALEAGVMSRHLVLSDNKWSQQMFGRYAFIVNPSDCDDVFSAVLTSLEKDANNVNNPLSSFLCEQHSITKSIKKLAQIFQLAS